MAKTQFDLVVVANRLPVDFKIGDDGDVSWSRSPGGLVSALAPLMSANDGAWVGWSGAPDLAIDQFDADGTWLIPVSLSPREIELYYEGFSNDTLWPLYHDVIATPAFHREWWETYRSVNEHFASMADFAAAPGATVWIQDYQLQLVPAMLRQARPDLQIGFFNHIPFPPLEIFSQLPWRRQVLEGVLGADLIGFQRTGDAANFLRCVRRLTNHTTAGQQISIDDNEGRLARRAVAAAFPISIDSKAFNDLARRPEVMARAAQIREELGNPKKIVLGVDRLDYTKGILHRVKAFGELLADGTIKAEDATLVQVASPSRENVAAYQDLRTELEVQVGRINGDYGDIGHQPISYLHHSYPAEEMAALYLAADVMLVTSLRDGMNLVAKEYAAARFDERGVLVLSEFTGAAEELHAGALMVNPHDIDSLKASIVRALTMPAREQHKLMRRLRRKVMTDDVAKWSDSFLSSLADIAVSQPEQTETPPAGTLGTDLRTRLKALGSTTGTLLIASDFDGVLAPLIDDPSKSRPTPRALRALGRLASVGGERVQLALVSGRDLATLYELSHAPVGTIVVGSHGAERGVVTADGLERQELVLTDGQRALLGHITEGLEEIAERHSGVWVERKPTAAVLHTRLTTHDGAEQAGAAAIAMAERLGAKVLEGKNVIEVPVVEATKGLAIDDLREHLGASATVYLGDDLTDEHAFAVLGPDDISIKVGAGESIAKFRIADSAAAALVLERVATAVAPVPLPRRKMRPRGGASAAS